MARDGSGVRKASISSIEITFMYKGVRCRERLKLSPTKENIKRAKLHRAAIQDAISKGTFDYSVTFPGSPRAAMFCDVAAPPEIMTIEVYLQDWLAQQKKRLHASTVDGYRKIVDGKIIPALGKINLHELTRLQVKQWVSQSKASNKTIGNTLSVLRAALQEAVSDGLLELNPIDGWRYKNKSPPKQTDDKDPFSRDEQAAILAACEGQGRNLIQFLFWSGVRTSEVVALEWRDIDWVGQTVTISRAMTQAADEAEETKTRAGNRKIKLLPPALEALRDQKQHTFLLRKSVFHNPRTGEPWGGDQPIRKTLWAHALERAGVRYRNPYQTRHTFASMMISSGENIRWLSHHLGHSDMLTTLRIYAKWLTDADQNAGMKGVENYSSATKKAE